MNRTRQKLIQSTQIGTVEIIDRFIIYERLLLIVIEDLSISFRFLKAINWFTFIGGGFIRTKGDTYL